MDFCRGGVIKIMSIEGEQGLWNMVFNGELAGQLWEVEGEAGIFQLQVKSWGLWELLFQLSVSYGAHGVRMSVSSEGRRHLK